MLLAFKRFATEKSHSFPEKIKVIVIMYREIQILCDVYNEIHKRVVVPFLIISFVMGISISRFMLISKSVERSIQNMLVFGPAVFISLVATLLAFQLAVRLYVESSTLLAKNHSWQNHQIAGRMRNQKKRQIMQRYCRSFPVLKIFFFERNFLEGNTTLNILDFSNNGATNLILLENYSFGRVVG